MLLVMRNLPSDMTYSDIKSLINNKCFVDEVILDKLFRDSPTTKKVTIGVAKDEDATRIMHSLNGTYIRGLQIYIEDMRSKSGKNSNNLGSEYRGQNDPNQMASYQQSSQNPWTAQQMGMQQYGYVAPTDQMGYQTQQGVNQQGMGQQMSYGYDAWMTSNNSGIPPLMQNNFMGYGNQQGQQGQQSSTSQGQYGGSAPGSQAVGAQKELGFGYTTGNGQSDREKGPSNQRGYGPQASYSGNQKDRGSQGSWRDSQQDRGRGSQGPWRSSDDRGRGFQKPNNESESRGYGSGNFDKDTRFGSGNDQKDSRGYGSQQPSNQREMGFDPNYSWENCNRGVSGFDRSREGDRESRKRRHSPEQVDRYRGNSKDRFQGGPSKLGGNPGRGFDSNRVTQDNYNRAGPSRDSYSTKPAPLLEKPNTPYSWSNKSNTSSRFNDKPEHFGGEQSKHFGGRLGPYGGDQSRSFGEKPRPLGGEQSRTFDEKPRPFGGDQSRSFDEKPRPFSGPESKNDLKPRIVWNSKYQPPPSQSSLSKGPSEKRPKIEKKPAVRAVVKKIDLKTVNRAISWRGEGVAVLAREIFQSQGSDSPLQKRGSSCGLKLLKKALNSRIDEIISQKYPDNPHPLLHDIISLYRETYPVWTDDKLCTSCAEEAPVTGTAEQKAKPKPNTDQFTPVRPMGATGPAKPQPAAPPLAKPTSREVKPFPKPISREVKPFPKPSPKPKLSDLLPPNVMQHPPRPKLMLGPNALKKKPKPYNVEKRARSEQKQLTKREFLEENLYKCPTPIMEEALNAILDEITDVFNSAVDEHPTQNKEEKLIGEAIKRVAAPEFRSMVRLHTIKRILKVTRTLMLRIFVSPGKAPKDNVEQALKRYGLLNLKSSSQSKTPMYMAGVKTYHNYDILCTTPGIPVQGRNGPCMITAKPLYLTMPFKFRRLLQEKKYAELTGDYDEKDDFGKGGKNNKDDGDDDYDDYDDEDEDEPDDDVVDVTKENEVIELSGDEKALNVDDEIKDGAPDIKNKDNAEITAGNKNVNVAKKIVKSKEGMVDLTMDEDDIASTADGSADIADEMGDSVVEIDEDEIGEDDLEDY